MNEREIFVAALQKPDAGERRAFLDDACGADATLRAQIEGLLQVHEKAGSFLEPAPPSQTAAEESRNERPGAIIGPYKLLEQIGEGGFGVVFMAEQSEPVRRRVALKVLKPGMDTRQVVARFEAERQALAIMDHPNIARVFDGGMTASGRPFFVMELVRGIPITDFCDQNHLRVRERLELFLDVCQAVQHAHQKGIIHRDIKPTNVLVTLNDDKPVVKVIDFGIAKSLGQQLTEKTLFTNFAQMIGTPLYMSPEQAQMCAVDVDTRSDIYSLGVLLYELLTGTTPFDKERLQTAAFDEIRRIIREEEPARPSTRFSTLGQAAATVSANRKSNANQLSQLCRGELDWIVMKALEKDRGRRYETANGFALDVRRYLADEPVQACPPSATYRLRKIVWRNRATFTAAALVFLAMAMGTAISIWQGVRATHATTVALKNESDALKAVDAEKVARKDGQDKLRDSYLAQAQARRWSGQVGRHFTSLDVLRKAAEIRPGLDLRNEAIACMPLVDLKLTRKWQESGCSGWNFDDDFERYARADTDGSISIRKVADDTRLATLSFPGEIAGWGSFSPDGKFLCVHYREPVLRLWNLESGKVIAKVDRAPGATHWGGQAFHPDSRSFVVSTGTGSIHIYGLPSGEELHRYTVGKTPAVLAVHPNEPKLAVCTWDNPNIQLLDTNTGKVLSKLVSSWGANTLAWHPAGRYLAAGNVRAVRIWDTHTELVHKTLDVPTSESIGCAFNHAGDLLASWGWDVTTRLWDPISGKELVNTPGYFLAFSRDDRRMSLNLKDVGHEVAIHELASGRRECRTLHAKSGEGTGPASTVEIHPDGRLMATTGDDGVRLWDLALHKELQRLPVGIARTALFEPDGKSLITYGTLGIQRWPMVFEREGNRLRIGLPQTISPALQVHQFYTRARLSQDGRWLAAVGPRGAVVFDLHQPGNPLRFDGHPGVRDVAISPDGRWVVTVTQHGKDIMVWDRHALEPVRTLPAANYSNAFFSQDGKWLFTSSIGREPQKWAVESWTPRALGKEYGNLFSMTSTSDGKLVALFYDGRPTLVDGTTYEVVATLTTPNPLRVSDLCLSPDGTLLAVGDHNQQAVQLWDLRALRQGLADINLAGDWPAYPPASQLAKLAPLQIEVQPGPK